MPKHKKTHVLIVSVEFDRPLSKAAAARLACWALKGLDAGLEESPFRAGAEKLTIRSVRAQASEASIPVVRYE